MSEEKFEESRRDWWIRVLWVPLVLALLAGAVLLFVHRDKVWADSNTCTSTEDGSGALWGPEREMVGPGAYDFAPEPSFNVDYANPNYGDERHFLLVKEATYNTEGGWADDVLQVRPGAELILRAFVHNGAADLPETVARETRMTTDLPTCEGKSIAITARISAANTTPSEVWDSVVLKSPTLFRIEMVPGSARLKNFSNPSDGLLLPDRIGTSDGALIGSHKADGNFGGNYNNTAIVIMRVKVLPAA